MKFLIGKYSSLAKSFVGYEEMEFSSVEQAKKFCRESDGTDLVYMVVRADKGHNKYE